MAETIESFVAKLQSEGVEAGQQAAEKIRIEAQQQAEQIIQEAGQQAEKLLADAKTEAENLLERSKTELELAARDVVFRLRAALNRVLEAIIVSEIRDKLPNTDFLSRTLHDLVLAYAAADIGGGQTMLINVSPKLQGELADWAVEMMHKHAQEAGMRIDLQGTLESAGFEYTVKGATVEVTLQSVTESICELVSPRIREVIEQAIGDSQGSTSQEQSQ